MKMNGLNEYSKAWLDKMAEIWRDRMALMEVFDTGNLYSSVSNGRVNISDEQINFIFQFLTYGIYVDIGVGRGYHHDNGGNLDILNPIYRHEHKMNKPRSTGKGRMSSGKPRKKAPWFSPSWYISVLVLKDKMSDIIGDNFISSFDNI